MHPADIKASLEKAGLSQADIARSVVGRSGEEVTPGAVHLVIKGLSKSSAIALRISQATGLSVHTLWPGMYPGLPDSVPPPPRARRAHAAAARQRRAHEGAPG